MASNYKAITRSNFFPVLSKDLFYEILQSYENAAHQFTVFSETHPDGTILYSFGIKSALSNLLGEGEIEFYEKLQSLLTADSRIIVFELGSSELCNLSASAIVISSSEVHLLDFEEMLCEKLGIISPDISGNNVNN